MISILVAKSRNDVIGKDNALPWHIPEDLKYFKRLTTGKTVVMGRNTFESIGRPLPNRTNVVLTRSRDFAVDGVKVIHDISEIRDMEGDEVFIIGGAKVLKDTMALADRLYLTEIHQDIEGDVTLPIDLSQWKLVRRTPGNQDGASDLSYEFCVYERR